MYLCVLAKPIMHCCLCRLFSITWLTVTLLWSICTHRHYIGTVLNSLSMFIQITMGKCQNPMEVTCTHSNCFDLSKVIIKIYNTDKSIASVYLYCFWILRVLLPALHTLTRHVWLEQDFQQSDKLIVFAMYLIMGFEIIR